MLVRGGECVLLSLTLFACREPKYAASPNKHSFTNLFLLVVGGVEVLDGLDSVSNGSDGRFGDDRFSEGNGNKLGGALSTDIGGASAAEFVPEIGGVVMNMMLCRVLSASSLCWIHIFSNSSSTLLCIDFVCFSALWTLCNCTHDRHGTQT